MPSLQEALRFATDPQTSPAQLRRACELLFLLPAGSSPGSPEEDRALLLRHLQALGQSAEVICLNPRVTEPE